MIDSVTSVKGHQYSWSYDLLNRLDTYTFPGGSETHTYDDDGRRKTRSEIVNGSIWHSDVFEHDARGLVTEVSVGGGMHGTVSNRYSGLGAVVEASVNHATSTGNEFLEQFTVDALGRSIGREMYNAGILSFETGQYSYEYVAGAVRRIVEEPPPPGSTADSPRHNENSFDDSGNVETSIDWKEYWSGQGGGPEAGEEQWLEYMGSRNYYGADERLMYRRVYRDSIGLRPQGTTQGTGWNGDTGKRSGVFEEYWYDALGRRVLVRARGRGAPETDALCWQTFANPYYEAQERFVWDGDQLLYEDRIPDPGLPGAPNPSTQYARIGYTHGGALDQPLDLRRSGKVVVLHTDWRGQFDAGSEPDGTQVTGMDGRWEHGRCLVRVTCTSRGMASIKRLRD